MTEIDFLDAVGRIDKRYIEECITHALCNTAEDFQITSTNKQRNNIKNTIKRRPTIAAIVALFLVTILTLVVGATLLFHWNDTLRNYLGITEEDSDQLAKAVTIIGQSQTHENMTITVEQAFGDTHTAYIVASIILPEGMSVDGKIRRITPKITDVDGSYNYERISVDEDTRIQTYIITIKSSNKKLTGRKIELEFGGYVSSTHEKLISATWNFTFKLDFDDLSKTIVLNQKVDDFIIESVWITPVSMIIYIRDLPPEARYVDDFDLIMKDGSSPEIIKYQIIGDLKNSNTTPIYGLFPQVIDPSMVKGILVNGIACNFE